MPEGEQGIDLNVLLDQNVPVAVGAWLQNLRPSWRVAHVSQLGLAGKGDVEIFGWCQENGYIIITFDEELHLMKILPTSEVSR